MQALPDIEPVTELPRTRRRRRYTVEDWQRFVGPTVAARRRQLGLGDVKRAAEVSGLSASSWYTVERGYVTVDGVQQAPTLWPSTEAAIAETLGWSPDWLQALLAGAAPASLVIGPGLAEVEVEAPTTIRQLLAVWADLDDEARRIVVDLATELAEEAS